MNEYPRGSEWRKWDLHVHTPETKKSDGYKVGPGVDIWEQFCTQIEESDVEVIGITDYFSVDNYYKFIEKYSEMFPNSSKRFFLNVELCLNQSVNVEHEEINIHLIFNPAICEKDIRNYFNKLETEKTGVKGKPLFVSELTGNDFDSATVNRKSIEEAFGDVFGDKANRNEYFLLVVAGNNDGIRPGARTKRGKKRKFLIADEIDKQCDAIFAGSQSTDHYLDTARLETHKTDGEEVAAKPCFAGSDSHSFEELNKWLGKKVKTESENKEITWIKADPTYEGLVQTLYEPRERVRIQEEIPDQKDSYKVIKSVTFPEGTAFPEEAIPFNSNMNSVIGSRSSGKSSLLAYMAYSLDPELTIKTQMAASTSKKPKEEDMGPAAGITWNSNECTTCEIEWATPVEQGKVIYIPQNYLYSISDRPHEVDESIQPVVFKRFPSIEVAYQNTQNKRQETKRALAESISHWFETRTRVEELENKILDIGDEEAIGREIVEIQEKVEKYKDEYSLTEEEIDNYQKVREQTTSLEEEIRIAGESIECLETIDFTDIDTSKNPEDIVTIQLSSLFESLPDHLIEPIEDALRPEKAKLAEQVVQAYKHILKITKDKRMQSIKALEALKETNTELSKTYEQYELLKKTVEKLENEKGKKKAIEKLSEEQKQGQTQLVQVVSTIKKCFVDWEVELSKFIDVCNECFENRDTQDVISLGVEADIDDLHIEDATECINLNHKSPFVEDSLLQIETVRTDISELLESLYSGDQKIKRGLIELDVASKILSVMEDIRFYATLDGDRIGGFKPSTMTPGKRALFALTLLLDDSEDTWPLLIDQPEDDLDSRSVYDQIVPYLKSRKKVQQIIMASHDANLVVGADSEEILVVNQHGNDRKNRDNRTFAFVTGSLENTKAEDVSQPFVLDTCGIREHACKILDGGAEAFEKRKSKYNL